MRFFDDFSAEEKAQFFKFVVIGIAALILTMHAVPFFGLGPFMFMLGQNAALVMLVIYFIIWRIFYLLIAGVCGGVVIIIVRIFANANLTAERIGIFTASVLTALFFGGEKFVTKLLGLLLIPLRWLGEAAWDGFQARFGLLLQRWREEQELRRLYREEFRGEFRSFREFKRHFESGGQDSAGSEQKSGNESAQREREAPKADPFAAACRLLGLSENGAFSQAELKERFRTLMKGIHPDVAGPNELAIQVNTACTLIRKRKGWS